MVTSMIKQFATPASGVSDLESAMVAQLGALYTPDTFQTLEVSNHSEFAGTCVIGNYIDAEHSIPIPFAAVNTAGEGVSSGTWVVVNLRDTMDFTVNPAIMIEQAGLFGIVEIPATSVNWSGDAWVAVGHAWIPALAVAANLSPIIVELKRDGTSTTYASELLGVNVPSAWLLTHFGVADTSLPNMMCDVVYDSQNDSLVAVGNCAPIGVGETITHSMFAELVSSLVPPTYIRTFSNGVSLFTNTPAFLRSCAIQTQDSTGATVANRTIVNAVGCLGNNGLGGVFGTWFMYQPNFSNPWGGNPRFSLVERGIGDVNDFFSQQGLSAGDTPTYLTLCRRLTADGEDIYIVGGIAPNGLFAYAISGIITDSTGGGNDNIISNAGGTTDLVMNEVTNEMGLLRDNTGGIYASLTSTSAITDVIALGTNNGTKGRLTKLYAVGYEENGRNAPLAVGAYGGSLAYIMAVSRGLKKASSQVATTSVAQGLFTNTSIRIKMAMFTQSAITKIAYVDSSLSPATTGTASDIIDVAVVTGNRTYAWFEYMLYDGIDALIARKLNEMGVRVTIGNVEWYKQDILKRGLDVSTDFFNEWSELQVSQNQDRERVANQFGRTKPRKRPVRTEIFDDYADWEEKGTQVKTFPDYDPNKDGMPFKDDVALEQEVEKTQKAVDDLRRIEETIEESTVDESEYDGASDVSDSGEN
jgi:hypothetical protein